MGVRAPRRAERGSRDWGGVVAPRDLGKELCGRDSLANQNFPSLFCFCQIPYTARAAGHHLWRGNCRDKDRGTVGKGVTNNDHRPVGTKRRKAVYEPPKYLTTELARNQ